MARSPLPVALRPPPIGIPTYFCSLHVERTRCDAIPLLRILAVFGRLQTRAAISPFSSRNILFGLLLLPNRFVSVPFFSCCLFTTAGILILRILSFIVCGPAAFYLVRLIHCIGRLPHRYFHPRLPIQQLSQTKNLPFSPPQPLSHSQYISTDS